RILSRSTRGNSARSKPDSPPPIAATSPAIKSWRASGRNSRQNHESAWDNSAAVAARIVTTIFERADNLAKFPHLGRLGRIPDTRELVVVDTPFIVPYRVRDAEVEILA